MKKNRIMSVVSIPLKTEPWQADILNKRMELCRQIYNKVLKSKLKSLREVESDPAYIQSRDDIGRAYRIRYSGETGGISGSQTESVDEMIRSARTVLTHKLRDAGISEYAFISDTVEEAKLYRENISSNMAIYSIAKPLWAAFDAYLHGDTDEIRMKERGTLNSIATDGKSGIRVTDASGHTLRTFDRGGGTKRTFHAAHAAVEF